MSNPWDLSEIRALALLDKAFIADWLRRLADLNDLLLDGEDSSYETTLVRDDIDLLRRAADLLDADR